jgi:hypothetical protein
MKLGVLAIILLLVAALVAFSAPDVKRYNNIRRM